MKNNHRFPQSQTGHVLKEDMVAQLRRIRLFLAAKIITAIQYKSELCIVNKGF